MHTIATFFMQNVVYVYFFHGLAFFAVGLMVILESGRASEFRFARGLLPLALFGLTHAAHEWLEMFQVLAAHKGDFVVGPTAETIRVGLLALSFLLLLNFGMRLLPGAEEHPKLSIWQTLAVGAIWAATVGFVYWRFRPSTTELLVAADVLARYSLAIPGSVLAAVVLLRERRDFHMRGMSHYGQGLLWAALAFLVFGVIGQLFTRPSLVFPSQTINTALFLRTFGIPIQLLRGLSAVVITVTLSGALRAFEQEGRIRLARANKARIEAQAAALQAQQRRGDEIETLNVQLRAAANELSAMYQVLQEREAQLAQLVRQLVNAQENERKRIAQELHDETGQKLTAMGMGLAAVEQQVKSAGVTPAINLVRSLRELSDQAIIELRHIMADLRPAQLDDLGLAPALRWYVNQYQTLHPDQQVSFSAGRLEQRLPPQHETVLFRAAQEALTNIARHARARNITVALAQTDRTVRLDVQDDGVGFDVTAPARHAAGSGLGLVGMRERVALVGGNYTVTSEPGQGTHIVIEVPLN